jgi:hypothetical protein
MVENITIEETLASSVVVSALTYSPYLLYSEILEGARRPLAFLNVVQEIRDLIGKDGNVYKFLKADQLTASRISEATMLASGMTAVDKTPSATTVSVTDIIECATQLSDFLTEDFPSVSWAQAHLQNMGKAVMEYLDAYVYSVIAAASGTETFDAGTTISYDDVIDALTEAADEDWISNPSNAPYFIASAGALGSLLKDTTFVSSERYTTADLSKMVAGELGKFAGCKILSSSLLAGTGYAYIVFPNNQNGVVVALVWKRPIMTKDFYVTQNGYTYMVTTARATPVVVQAKGIVKITITGSP